MAMQNVHINVEKGSSVADSHIKGKFMSKEMIGYLEMLAIG